MITKLFGAYRNLSCDSRYLEWYRSGHNEHDWKSCGRVERPEGSNPSHSALKITEKQVFSVIFLYLSREIKFHIIGMYNILLIRMLI